jgi:YfiH family protein
MPHRLPDTGVNVAAEEDLGSRLARGALLASIPGVLHGVTSRVEGMGVADGNVGLGAPRDRGDAWTMRQAWCKAIGTDADRLVTAHQVHGAEVLLVSANHTGRSGRADSSPMGMADALITRDRGVALMTLHADCLPILLVDPDTPGVASVHAGWRGTVLNVAGATVRAMTGKLGSRPDRIVAFLAPSIGACCYEVGDEVVDAWREQANGLADRALRPGPNRLHFDLKTANRLLLKRAGLHGENIETSPVCTRCQGREWFSHRGQGPHTGRFGAIIALAKDPTGA